MPKSQTPFQAAIGKLILELDRSYMSQVEDGQPLENIDQALDKAHRLLKAKSGDDAKSIIGPQTLRQYFGNVWLGAWPAITEKLDAAEAVLRKSSSN